MQWDLFDRLVHYDDARLEVDYAYDALGRRLYKDSNVHYKQRPEAGSQWNHNEHARKQRELGCGFTLYGWDGDNLAWESSPAQLDGGAGRTVHYVYGVGSFIPVAQAVRSQPIDLLGLPDYSGDYSLDEDPLWKHKPAAQPFDALAWYQCDHLGTPQELTDQNGNIAWSAQSKAWGEVREQYSEWALQQRITNPIRFQGQYHDHETGLHYNRHRYYDPGVGRFISKDPISYSGGLNLYTYALNPIGWIDPLGLTSKALAAAMNGDGIPTPTNSAAHHIVGENSVGAKPARDILEDHKIPIDSTANGVFLPNKNNTDGMPGIRHCGRHPNAYLDTVNERVIEANTRGGKQAVLAELQDMRGALSTADRNADWKTVLDKK